MPYRLIGTGFEVLIAVVMKSTICFLAQLIFSTLKMEAICSSGTSVDTQQTSWGYIPEDGTLQSHRCLPTL
jgi:hypothetical protein